MALAYARTSGSQSRAGKHHMSTFGNPILLKSQYMSIFVFIVSIACSVSLMYQCFQSFPKGAYLLISLYSVFCAYLAKVLISVSLGILALSECPECVRIEYPEYPVKPEYRDKPQHRPRLAMLNKRRTAPAAATPGGDTCAGRLRLELGCHQELYCN